MNKKKYISPDGIEYESYQAYCNSDDLDPDIVYNYLAKGKRQPQNEEEIRWQKEGRKILKQGYYEMWFN